MGATPRYPSLSLLENRYLYGEVPTRSPCERPAFWPGSTCDANGWGQLMMKWYSASETLVGGVFFKQALNN